MSDSDEQVISEQQPLNPKVADQEQSQSQPQKDGKSDVITSSKERGQSTSIPYALFAVSTILFYFCIKVSFNAIFDVLFQLLIFSFIPQFFFPPHDSPIQFLITFLLQPLGSFSFLTNSFFSCGNLQLDLPLSQSLWV